MATVRRRLSLSVAWVGVVYLLATAAFMATVGPDVLRMGHSPTPMHVLALSAVASALHVGAATVLLRGETFRRRYVFLAGVAEMAIGLLVFWLAPGLHGRFAPPGEQLMPIWAMWGAVGPAIAGIALAGTALIHPRAKPRVREAPISG